MVGDDGGSAARSWLDDLGLTPPLSDPGLLERSRVMIVDDTSANVVLLERMLAMGGLKNVEAFTDPRAALERCLESVPDLLLLDLHMPRLNGFAFLESLRSGLADDVFLPVLVLTGDADTEVRQRALAAGAKDFLTKPFDHVEVILRVRNLLESKDLYTRLQRHTAELQAELDEQRARARAEAEEHRQRAGRVEQLLAGNFLSIVFQPIVSLVDGRLVGTEALARFDYEPSRPPDEWFADAAAVGRGVELELKAVALALAHLDQLPADIFMSVNASPGTAVSPGLTALLRAHACERIVVELTEHEPVLDYLALLAALGDSRLRGVRIAVDDTGAGYAGLQHLLRLQPDVIKLDIALTRGIDGDPARRALASALVAFSREIGATLIAEGVESPGELRTLRALGVPTAQGFHLARPGPLLPPGADFHDVVAGIAD